MCTPASRCFSVYLGGWVGSVTIECKKGFVYINMYMKYTLYMLYMYMYT